MNELITIAIKDLRLLMRDKAGFILTFGLPLILAALIGAVFSGITTAPGTKTDLLVVNQDGSDASWEFVEALNATEELSVQTVEYDKAMEMLKEGTGSAYIILNPDFGQASSNQFSGDPVSLELGVSSSKSAKKDVLEGILTKYAVQKQNRLPIEFKNVEIAVEQKGPRNAFDFAFPLGLIWGILGCTATFAISLVVEKSQGTLIRLQMSPIKHIQILGGKGLACFIITIATSALTFLFGIVVFGIQPHSYLYLLMAITTISLAFSGLMMFLSIFAKTQRAAAAIAWTVLQLLAWLGGGGIPLFVMPQWMYNLSYISPVRWAILAMEGATWRQFDFNQMLQPCGIMVGTGVLFFVIGAKVFKWAK